MKKFLPFLSVLLLISCSQTNKDKPIKIAINKDVEVKSINGDFLGLSHEWGQSQMIMGNPTIGTNLIYRQLLANLTDLTKAPISIRIGGSTTDKQPDYTAEQIIPLQQLFENGQKENIPLNFIVGINLGSGKPELASQQAKMIRDNLSTDALKSIELGNQPDGYGTTYGYRPADYSFSDYIQDVQKTTDAIIKMTDDKVKFTGPSSAGFAGKQWMKFIPATDWGTENDYQNLMKTVGDRFNIIGQHAYNGGSSSMNALVDLVASKDPKDQAAVEKMKGNADIKGMIELLQAHSDLESLKTNLPKDYLLQPQNTTNNANNAKPYIAIAHQYGKRYRISEMNSIMASGEPGISNSFQASLWFIDQMFEFADAGVDGINLHVNNWNSIWGDEVYGAFIFGIPENQYKDSKAIAPPKDYAFTTSYELQKVMPNYYGMYFFADATKGKANIQPLRLNTNENIKAWYVETASGEKNIVIINKSDKKTDFDLSSLTNSATVKRLSASGFSAQKDISYAGQTFDSSKDGKLLGTQRVETINDLTEKTFVEANPYEAVLITLK